jgi:hypothetical protein
MHDEHRERDAPLSFEALQASFEHQRSFSLRTTLSAGDGGILGGVVGERKMQRLVVSHQKRIDILLMRATAKSCGDPFVLPLVK